jgi:3-phosphoglycerate kinase
MKHKVRMIIFSHLSDVQEPLCQNTNDKINFVKALLMEFPNTDVEISNEEADNIWDKYITQRKK